MWYIIYADIESLIKRIDGCANNPEKSSTTKIGECIHCGYSMSKFCYIKKYRYRLHFGIQFLNLWIFNNFFNNKE